ncbi:50S ribosomal protein L18P [groundwater metagenome]|uniref:50S ribosomal protein L18 n=1 Tax=groundwater metagenome TaxID=717931 RepID=A0A098E7E0_9ZZZZ
MATNTNYSIKYRRRRENKTNYKKRLNLLKSKSIRLVIRPTNKYIIAQLVDFHPDGDKIMCSANSKELKKLGWNISCSNTPAAYLTGFLCGLKAIKISNTDAILDIGIKISTKGSKIYAVGKGAVDAGMKIPLSDEILPDEKRLKGGSMSEATIKIFEQTLNNIKNSFSK